jgi:hypothetical protein
MPDNINRTRGRGQGYKFDRGGTPAESGPFIGRVKNNIDPTRAGRLQVYIEQFSGGDETDESLWRTVGYIPPFYGSTLHSGAGTGPGTFTGNQQCYGMWFTPPDIGVSVICFFIEGDPNQGYYTGVVPDEGINHMLPAIGAGKNYNLSNGPQDAYFKNAKQLPVTEINTANDSIFEDPRFFDKPKPVHSVVAGVMLQQGLINDTIRGPITSNAQRESPSAVFGISTPGRPVYQGGLAEQDIKQKLESGAIKPQDVEVIARRGGHSIVMDDGNLEGQDEVLRIRTSKGHQITMSDDGDCFYIIHANGQTWLEFGKQGTVDIFSTNSINLRTQGTLNLHADKDINMYAGGTINMKSQVFKAQADYTMDLIGVGATTIYSKSFIGIRSDGSLGLKAIQSGGFDGGSSLNLKAGCINLNGGGAPPPVNVPKLLQDFKLADTSFQPNVGWVVKQGALPTIVTRAPTHEPYPYHNQGTSNLTQLGPAEATSASPAVTGVLNKIKDVLPGGTIDASSFLTQNVASISLGTLNTSQITGLLSQASNFVDQDFNVISVDKGVGKFGFSAEQLETAGFLKPGTVSTYLSNPNNLTEVLSSPSVWTGRGGVTNLGSLLSDVKLQDATQQDIMTTALTGLQKSGVITGSELPAELGTILQVASKFGNNNAVSWVAGKSDPSITTSIDSLAKGAQYAVNFVDQKLGDIAGTGKRIGGFTQTVNRTSLDDAVSSIIGDDKVPSPNFSLNLYASSTNDTLVYTGSDPTVWARINSERLSRGLSSLEDLGYPNPGIA